MTTLDADNLPLPQDDPDLFSEDDADAELDVDTGRDDTSQLPLFGSEFADDDASGTDGSAADDVAADDAAPADAAPAAAAENNADDDRSEAEVAAGQKPAALASEHSTGTGQLDEFDLASPEEQTRIMPTVPAYGTQIADGLEKTGVIPAAPTENAPKHSKNKKHGKALLITMGVVVGVLAVAYLGGALWFSSHFFPNTTVNGQDVSGIAGGELAQGIDSKAAAFSLTISGDGIEASFDAADIDLSSDGASYAKAALAQNSIWTWPYQLTRTHRYKVESGITYNEQTVESLIMSQIDEINATGSDPQDAQIVFDETDSAFVVQDEVMGTKVNAEETLAEIDAAITQLKTTLSLGKTALVQPAYYASDERLIYGAAQANTLIGHDITLTINGEEVGSVSTTETAQWIGFDDQFNPFYSQEKIEEWASSYAKSANTRGSTRVFTNPAGKEVTVSGGTYGWSIDTEQFASDLISAVLDGNTDTVEISMSSSAALWAPGGRDFTRYLDVDLTNQYAVLYDENNQVLWQSSFVSGNVSEGYSTPTGTYVINYKSTNETLIGSDEDGDGEPDYETPVSYWMPFVGNSVGLHDASWRSSFGGSIYYTNGSHGCVNLPTSAAATLYSLIQVGDVVCCHN